MASDLGLHCLPLSHKKDTRLIKVKETKQKSTKTVSNFLNSTSFMYSVHNTEPCGGSNAILGARLKYYNASLKFKDNHS